MTNGIQQPQPESRGRHLGAEAAAGTAAQETYAPGKKRTKKLPADSMKAYQALYEGAPAAKSPANDPLVGVKPADVSISLAEVPSKKQLYTLFSLMADMGIVFQAQANKIQGIDKSLEQVGGQINTILEKMTDFTQQISAMNQEIKSDEPPKWLSWLEDAIFTIIGVVVGGALGGPVGAVAAAALAAGNLIASNVKIKKGGKEESLWDAALGNLSPAEQFFVKLAISLAVGVITGAATAAFSNFADSALAATEEAAEESASGAGDESVPVDEPGTASGESIEMSDMSEQAETEEAGARRIDEDKEASEQQRAQKQTQSLREKILESGRFKNANKRAFWAAFQGFAQTTGDIKSTSKGDDAELGTFGDLFKACGASNAVAEGGDFISQALEIVAMIGGGASLAKNPQAGVSLIARAMEYTPMASAILEAGASIGTAVTQFKIAHLYTYLATLTKESDLLNKQEQAAQWDQQIFNAMLKQAVKENSTSMQTVTDTLAAVRQGLSSTSQQRA